MESLMKIAVIHPSWPRDERIGAIHTVFHIRNHLESSSLDFVFDS